MNYKERKFMKLTKDIDGMPPMSCIQSYKDHKIAFDYKIRMFNSIKHPLVYMT